MSSSDVEDKDVGGRPKEGIKYGQHKNAFGWDPMGIKQIKQDFNPENQKTAFQPDPRYRNRQSTVATEQILRKMKPTKMNIITETLKPSTETDADAGTMLDENNIL